MHERRTIPPGRHQSARRPWWRRPWPGDPSVLAGRIGVLVVIAMLIAGGFVFVLVGGYGAAATTAGDQAARTCHRADNAWAALVAGGVQYKQVHGVIDDRALDSPQLRRLYAAAQRAHLACQATTPPVPTTRGSR